MRSCLRCSVLLAALLAACDPTIPEGRLACASATECPDGWHCHSNGRCYSTPEADAGASDANAADTGDGSPPADASYDVSIDTGRDARTDAPVDARNDVAVDAPADAPDDTSTVVDAPGDASADDSAMDWDVSADADGADVMSDGDGDLDGASDGDSGLDGAEDAAGDTGEDAVGDAADDAVDSGSGGCVGGGLVAYWPFDGDASDVSGAALDLTVYGGAAYGSGILGQALSLTGTTSQYAARPGNDPDFEFGDGDFTIQLWVNFATTSGEQVLIEKYGAGGGWTFTKIDAYLEGNTFHLHFDYPNRWFADIFPISTSTWHHLVLRRAATAITLIYDNSVVMSGTVDASYAPAASGNPLRIGQRVDGPSSPLNGLIDEVAVWDRALSDPEVASLYGGGSASEVCVP